MREIESGRKRRQGSENCVDLEAADAYSSVRGLGRGLESARVNPVPSRIMELIRSFGEGHSDRALLGMA